LKILITGVAGFVGMHVAKVLLERGEDVIGIDNMSGYYDVTLKEMRLKILKKYSNFSYFKVDVENINELKNIFQKYKPCKVLHLAAQAGVRYSLESTKKVIIETNMLGFYNVLELCKEKEVEHLVYASSSSVYGINSTIPYQEIDNVDRPASLYAATKKSNELMAHAYSHLYGLKQLG